MAGRGGERCTDPSALHEYSKRFFNGRKKNFLCLTWIDACTLTESVSVSCGRPLLLSCPVANSKFSISRPYKISQVLGGTKKS
ncbi:hypothetical protein QQP08_009073 [Theobroma cacao]|uniref:Uncharacterized protein n=1 Tax=Theobroma cacao TaxID=3641 RepID=A0A061DZD2_THECC|nr:Uncharacterized protein TCM_006659 [Theobroma cacao]WRX16586.1 hypothetical protein QQP08_009073 [Theobroma cacao]